MKKKIFLTGIMLALCSTLLASCHKSRPEATESVEFLPSSTINQEYGESSTIEPIESTTNNPIESTKVEPTSSSTIEPTQSTTIAPTESSTADTTSTTVSAYTITFDANGGLFADGASTTSYTSYGVIVSVQAPTKDGSNFTGWYKDEACSIEFSFDEKASKDTTLYAGWEIKKFTMTFDCNGGAFTDKQTKVSYQMPYGATVAVPEDPVRACYKFIGWFADKDLQEEFDFTKPFSKTTTVYAGWEQTGFAVTFDANGGTINGKAKEEVVVNKNETCQAPTNEPTKADYEFYGWYYDKNADKEFDPSLAITADITVYAIYLEIDVSIKEVAGYEVAGDYIMASFGREVNTISLDGKVTLAPNCSYKIYSDEECKNEITTITLEDGLNEFYVLVSATTSSKKVKYILYVTKPEAVKIKYSFNGIIIFYEQEYTDELYEITYEPDVPGYEFGWWCFDEACEEMLSDNDLCFIVQGETTFYAYNEPKNDIKYVVNHFKMNESGEYDDIPSEVEECQGATGNYTSAVAKEYENYRALEFDQVIIAGNGSSVVNIYYEDVLIVSFAEAVANLKDKSFVKINATGDFVIPTFVMSSITGYEIGWYLSDDLLSLDFVDEKLYVRNKYYLNTEAPKKVSIAATIGYNDTSETVTYEFEIPQFKISTLAEYDAAPSKTQLNVKGIITAVGSYYNGYGYIMVEDISGVSGYYGYQIKITEEAFNNDFVVGNTIILSGEKNLYYNTREFNNTKYYIVSTDTQEVKNTDITSAITSGAGLSSDLICQQVYFSNLPLISKSEVNKDGTFSILCGDSTDKSKQALIYVNKYFTQTNSANYNIWKNLNLVAGDVISFHGFVCGAKIDGVSQLYLEPYEANGITINSHDYSPELLSALDNAFSFDSLIKVNSTYTLPNVASLGLTSTEIYDKYTVEWTSNSSIATINENTLIVELAENDTNITITLSIKDGENIVQTKSYNALVNGAKNQIEAELANIEKKIGSATITEKKQYTLSVPAGFTIDVSIEEGKTTVTWDDELGKLIIDPAEAEETAEVTITLYYASFSSSKSINITTMLSNTPIIDTEENTVTWAAAESGTYLRKDYSSLDITSKIGADIDLFNVTVFSGASTNIIYLDSSKFRLYTDSSLKVKALSDENYTISIASIKIYGTDTTLGRITLKINDEEFAGSKGKDGSDPYLEFKIDADEFMIYTSGEANFKKVIVNYLAINNNLSDEDRANNELRRVISTIEETYFEENSEIALSAKNDYILNVELPEECSSISWDSANSKLIIAPKDTLEEIDVTISITYGLSTKSGIVTISSKLPDAPDGLEEGTFTINLKSCVDHGTNNDVVTDLTTILGANPDIFEIYARKNDASNNVFY